MSELVVIVDDDLEDIDILCDAITRRYNAHCRGFARPHEALETLRVIQLVPPDYIFVDVNMPKMSGIEFVKEARQVIQSEDTVIIGLSTGMSAGLNAAMLDAGADYAFAKPVDMVGYERILQEVFQLSMALR